MIDYTNAEKFKRLTKLIELSDGLMYCCVEINSVSNIKAFIAQLQATMPDRKFVEVNFSPDAKERGEANTELVCSHYYTTLQNFANKFGDDTILILTNLAQSAKRDDASVIDLVSRINFSRDSFTQYPSVVIFVFQHWFMDKMFQQAHDFISQLYFHFDLTDIQDSDNIKAESVFSTNNREGKYSVSLDMKDLYVSQIKGEYLPLIERLEAMQKLVNLLADYHQTDTSSQELIDYVRNFAENVELKTEKRKIYVANVFDAIGNYQFALGNYNKALEYYKTALKIRKNKSVEQSSDVAKSYNNIGSAYYIKGEYDEALQYCFKALKICKAVLGEQHPETQKMLNNLRACYVNAGNDPNTFKEWLIEKLNIKISN